VIFTRRTLENNLNKVPLEHEGVEWFYFQERQGNDTYDQVMIKNEDTEDTFNDSYFLDQSNKIINS